MCWLLKWEMNIIFMPLLLCIIRLFHDKMLRKYIYINLICKRCVCICTWHQFKQVFSFCLFSCGFSLKIGLKITHMCRCSNDFMKCVPSLPNRKIRLSQLPRETKAQTHHTTASHDNQKPADPIYPCANAAMLQDVFSADAPCTEVILSQSHPLCHPTLCWGYWGSAMKLSLVESTILIYILIFCFFISLLHNSTANFSYMGNTLPSSL